MPITKTTGYKASDGEVYATVEEAQKAELEALVNRDFEARRETQAAASDALMPADVARFIIEHTDNIVAILTTGPRSRPKARKASGTTNPRRAVKRVTPDRHDDTPTAAGARAEAAMDVT